VKTVIITQNIPYPLTDGGKVAQFTIIDYLRDKCSITLLVLADTEADHIAVQGLKSIWENVTVKVISVKKQIPVPELSLYRLVSMFFVKNIAHVKYRINKLVPTSRKSKIQLGETPPHGRLRYLVSFAPPREKEIIDQIVNVIADVQPDIVQMDFVDTLDLSLCIPKNVKKIFVHHEIRFRRIETELNTLTDLVGSYGFYIRRMCEVLEVNLLNTFDGIVTFSEEDRSLLLQKLSVKNIISSPFPVLNKEILEIRDENLVIDKLVFVGIENHSPNKDAVEWYINNLAQLVQDRLKLVLHVIGKWSTEFKMKHEQNPSVHFAGFVEDLSGYCKNSIMIVPIRIGSGIRTKILYSMAWGTPVISTTIGSAGILDNDKILLTANTAVEFVEAIDKILADHSYCKSMVLSAQSVLRKHYSQQSAGEKRLLFYKSILEN
jgi:glycosyltransferase involved in cell wall biosynthesis